VIKPSPDGASGVARIVTSAGRRDLDPEWPAHRWVPTRIPEPVMPGVLHR
jgi:hypothetical protein